MALTKVTNDLLALGESTEALGLPKGTTEQRPSSPVQGMTRQNTDDDVIEYYDGTEWKQVSATGPITTYSVDFLLVGGGGGGGQRAGGGAGAGGLRTSYGTTSGGGSMAESSLFFDTNSTYTITVGSGGAYGSNGEDTSITGSDITDKIALGGGRGGNDGVTNSGTQGGSGGGGRGAGGNGLGAAGTIGQGFSGGNAGGGNEDGGGGGGAGNVGAVGQGSSGNGGDGIAVNIINSTDASLISVGEVASGSTYYAGGGGGSFYASYAGNGNGGIGGGGDGAKTVAEGNPGLVNTGGGGGGGYQNSNGSDGRIGGTGGSGVAILRMPTENYSGTTTGSPTVFTDGSDTILVYKSSGTYTA
jgi:hypothetical protein